MKKYIFTVIVALTTVVVLSISQYQHLETNHSKEAGTIITYSDPVWP
ncbi:hypothetical protein [Niallia sp. 03133]